MELTFPIAVLIVLYVAFVAIMVLITPNVLATAEQCSCSIKAVSRTPFPTPRLVGWGWARGREGT